MFRDGTLADAKTGGGHSGQLLWKPHVPAKALRVPAEGGEHGLLDCHMSIMRFIRLSHVYHAVHSTVTCLSHSSLDYHMSITQFTRLSHVYHAVHLTVACLSRSSLDCRMSEHMTPSFWL